MAPTKAIGEPLMSLDQVDYFISGLSRPECILATASGDLFASDKRGGVSWILPDGTVKLILAPNPHHGFLPNGLALLPDRSVLIADVGAGGVWKLTPEGVLTPFLVEVEGRKLPSTNFVHRDQKGRVWATISTWQAVRSNAAKKGFADGSIILADDRGTRVAADGLAYTNEAKVHPSGAAIYVNETIGRRISRLDIRSDGSLGPRQTVTEFDDGCFVDGLDFDRNGDVWVTCVVSNRIFRVDHKTGDQQLILEDVDRAHVDSAERKFHAGEFPGWEAGNAKVLGNPASINFGGADLRTAYIGFPGGERIARFRSPVAGAPPPHWNY